MKCINKIRTKSPEKRIMVLKSILTPHKGDFCFYEMNFFWEPKFNEYLMIWQVPHHLQRAKRVLNDVERVKSSNSSWFLAPIKIHQIQQKFPECGVSIGFETLFNVPLMWKSENSRKFREKWPFSRFFVYSNRIVMKVNRRGRHLSLLLSKS